MTARVKKVIDEMAELSAPELEELVEQVGELRAVDAWGRRGKLAEIIARYKALSAANDAGRHERVSSALLRFIERHEPDPEFADDIEASVRELRARDDRTSPWEP
jgi:hypothetical protein